MITETQSDETFQESQLLMDGFTTRYKMDRNTNGGGTVFSETFDILVSETKLYKSFPARQRFHSTLSFHSIF